MPEMWHIDQGQHKIGTICKGNPYNTKEEGCKSQYPKLVKCLTEILGL